MAHENIQIIPEHKPGGSLWWNPGCAVLYGPGKEVRIRKRPATYQNNRLGRREAAIRRETIRKLARIRLIERGLITPK